MNYFVAVTTKAKPELKLIDWLGEGVRRLALFPLMRLFTPLQVEGLENLTGDKPFIFAPNHNSHLDTPLLLAALPANLRMQTRVAAAADYFFNKRWKGLAVRLLLNAFPFTRKGPGRSSSVLEAAQLLANGHSLLIFPEGTRSPNGNLQPFKRGIGQLAAITGTQIVPVWIEGTHLSLPKGAYWPRRQTIKIVFGKPQTVTPQADTMQVATTVRQEILKLSSQDSEFRRQNLDIA